MAQTWDAKAVADIVLRTWTVPVPDGDSVSSIATIATGVTVDLAEKTTYNEASFTLSAGAAGVTGNVVVTITTTEGLSLSETFYIPIRVTAAQLVPTVNDVCAFALRKIVGNGETADADELADAVERFNDLVALWALQGIDIGLSDPLAAADTVTVPDGFIAALKFNLRVACHDHYDAPISGYDASMAQMTFRTLANALVRFDDLAMPPILRVRASELTET